MISLPVVTIQEIVKKYHNNIFPDLLSIDVEGLDEEILRSIDFETNFPKIICVETQNYAKGMREESIISFLEEKNFKIVAETGLNTIFINNNII